MRRRKGQLVGLVRSQFVSGVTVVESIEQRIEKVSNDREHGSRWLVRETISILYDLASDTTLSPEQSIQRLQAAAQKLAQARPAMAAIAGAAGRILNAPGGLPGMAQEAARLREDYGHATERIVEFARPLLKGTLLTLSISGTVLDVLVACRDQIERVIVLEGRPRYEGRDMSLQLARRSMGDMAVTLITDAQADIFLPQCHAVVVGADTILANSDVLNKAGTALLAWAARGHKVPFYVLSETLKISPRSWSDDLAQLEEKEAEEVLERPIEGVRVRNFYFDHTPARLVTKIITEQGLMGRRRIEQLASTLQHQ